MSARTLFPADSAKYLETHPRVAEQLRRAEEVYKMFGAYLNLTQSRVIIRESGASTNEVDLNGALLRTDR